MFFIFNKIRRGSVVANPIFIWPIDLDPCTYFRNLRIGKTIGKTSSDVDPHSFGSVDPDPEVLNEGKSRV